MFARREAEGATTVIRTSSIEYVELWREGQLDVDFVVSSELETAYAISRILGVPAARQTDVFADGQVQIGEFDVDEDASRARPRRPAPRRRRSPTTRRSRRSSAATRRSFPAATTRSRTGDRIVVIGSPRAAKAWSTLLWPEGGTVRDVVIYGAGRVGIGDRARPALPGDQRPHDRGVARAGAARGRGAPEGARLQRDRLRPGLPRARADRPVAGRDLRDARRREEPVRGVARAGPRHPVHHRDRPRGGLRAARSTRPGSTSPSTRAAVTAEEIVRFAHDPRTQQVAMLEGNRYEVLDVTTRESSRYIGMAFRDMPVHGSIIGAIVRNGDGDLPARRRRPPGGRPRDHLHRGGERTLGRRGAVS